jgi:hypothetical protein
MVGTRDVQVQLRSLLVVDEKSEYAPGNMPQKLAGFVPPQAQLLQHSMMHRNTWVLVVASQSHMRAEIPDSPLLLGLHHHAAVPALPV